MHRQRVRYKFIDNIGGGVYELPEDPKGWEESERKIKRSTKNFSMWREYSMNLEFVGQSRQKLIEYYTVYDVEADITLVEERLVPNAVNEEWYVHTSGEIDFSDFDKSRNTFKLPFLDGGLRKEIDAQIGEKFDLKRLESLKGDTLEELELQRVNLTSREILLVSTLTNASESYSSSFGSARFIPTLNIVSNSDALNIKSVNVDPIYLPPWTDVDYGKFFYFDSDVEKTVTLRINAEFIGIRGVFENIRYWVNIRKYNYDSVTSQYSNWQNIYLLNDVLYDVNDYVIIDQSVDIDLIEGDSLMFEVFFQGVNGTGGVNILRFRKLEISVTEDSQTPDTSTDAVFVHDAIDRSLEIITGEKGLLYSSVFGRESLDQYTENGEYALNALTLGFWIRQFYDKPIETSLKDLMECVDTLTTCTYSIYKIKDKQRFVVEPLDFFFQPRTIIDLGEVSELEEKPAKEFYHRGIELGYKKPDGDRLYEEAMGLDEHNVKNTWALPITRSESTFKKVSPIRNDGYGKAFASRRPKLNYPEEDTQYDKDLFYLDLKQGLGLAYLEKTWQDDYEEVPTGIYSPNTATGLNFTPFRCLERHEFMWGSAFKKDYFKNKYVRFASSVGNSDLGTKKVDEPIRLENGDKKLSEITSSRIYPYWYSFKKKVDYDLSRLIEGYTSISGRQVPNVFFKVRFTYRNVVHYGYIFELNPDKEGDWKLLKAN